MGDNRNRTLETLTPIPTPDLTAIARNFGKVERAVVSIETSVGTIQRDLLPPVATASKEARDGVLRLEGRVNALESKPPPPHNCTETEHQTEQDTAIAKTSTTIAQHSRLVWWLAALVVTVGGSAVGFALSTRSAVSETTAHLEQLDGVGNAVQRHEVQIKSLERAQEQDRQVFLREIRALPEQIQTAAPPAEQVDDAVDDLPLHPSERRQLLHILERARARKQDGNGR